MLYDIVGKVVVIVVSKRIEFKDFLLEEFLRINFVFEEDVYIFLGVENFIVKFWFYGLIGVEFVVE